MGLKGNSVQYRIKSCLLFSRSFFSSASPSLPLQVYSVASLMLKLHSSQWEDSPRRNITVPSNVHRGVHHLSFLGKEK